MGTTERVIQYLEFKGISKYKFCKDLDLSNKFLDNSSNMGTDKACKILHHYPELNADWLLTGQGPMLKSAVKKEVQGLDPPDTGHYKELAAARLEIIEGLKFKVAMLERELSELKQAPKDPILYSFVAEPAPELIGKKHK